MKNLILLHFVVLIFGFTGILGKLINVPSENLVWYRMGMASIALAAYLWFKGKSFKMTGRGIVVSTFTGGIIAAHWIFFFESIKQSNVSITLAALATSSLFTSLLEPIFFRRKIKVYELFLGSLVIFGLYFIFQFETELSIGLLLGLIAAFLASLFTVINGLLIKQYDSVRISFYELSGGTLAISLYLLMQTEMVWADFEMSISDFWYILILSILCTAFAFVASVKVMEELSPFTLSLSINLEPVYGILLAVLFFGDEEKMSIGFYFGTLMILTALFINVLAKRRRLKKSRKNNRETTSHLLDSSP